MHDINFPDTNSVAPENICSCSQPALLYSGYLTTYFQETRHCQLHIEKYRQQHDLNQLSRSIRLCDAQQRCHAIADIHIHLQDFSAEMTQQLIESNLPFGHILQQAGIRPLFKNPRYFMLSSPLLAGEIAPYRSCCPNVFGRFHTLVNSAGTILAEIYEALP